MVVRIYTYYVLWRSLWRMQRGRAPWRSRRG